LSYLGVLRPKQAGQGKEVPVDVWDDMDVERFETISPTVPHRPVDLEILNADKEGYLKSYLLIIPVVCGEPKSRFVDAGIQHSRCTIVVLLGKPALERGEAGVIGEGKNVWSIVDVNDCAYCVGT